MEDVLVQGFVCEEKGGLEYHPMLRTMFLKVGARLIRLESTEQYSVLEMSEVQAVTPSFEVGPDTKFCFSSVCELLLVDPMGDNRIECIETYGTRKAGEIDRFAALGIRLHGGQYLFFDPTFIFGIKVGGARQRENWLRNIINASLPWHVYRSDLPRDIEQS